MTAEELAEAHRFVEVWERAGYMNSEEAAILRTVPNHHLRLVAD
jgi:hypothetical protein